MGARLKAPKALEVVSFVVQPKAINSNKSPADSGTRLAFRRFMGPNLAVDNDPETAPADYCMWCKTVITVTVTNTDAPAYIRSSPGTANSSAPCPGARHWRSALRGHPLLLPHLPRGIPRPVVGHLLGRSSSGKLHPQTQRRLGDRHHGAVDSRRRQLSAGRACHGSGWQPMSVIGAVVHTT